MVSRKEASARLLRKLLTERRLEERPPCVAKWVTTSRPARAIARTVIPSRSMRCPSRTINTVAAATASSPASVSLLLNKVASAVSLSMGSPAADTASSRIKIRMRVGVSLLRSRVASVRLLLSKVDSARRLRSKVSVRIRTRASVSLLLNIAKTVLSAGLRRGSRI